MTSRRRLGPPFRPPSTSTGRRLLRSSTTRLSRLLTTQPVLLRRRCCQRGLRAVTGLVIRSGPGLRAHSRTAGLAIAGTSYTWER